MGPYLVVHRSPPLYNLRDRKRDVVYHHGKLKLCQDRAIPLWIRKLRNRFYQEEEEEEETVSPLQAEDLMSAFHQFESPDPPGPDPGPSVKPPLHPLTLVTRRGRNVRRPKYLAGYVTD